jgi:hypothetical protein
MTDTKKLDMADRLDRAIMLVKVVRMAAVGDATPTDYGDPIMTGLDVALDELAAIRRDMAV